MIPLERLAPGRRPAPRYRAIAITVVFLALGAASCDSTQVALAPVAAVEVVPPLLTVVEGARDTVTAVVRGRGGRELRDRAVRWSTVERHVAAVTGHGVVFGRSPGVTLMIAESEGVVGTAQIEVLRAPTIHLAPGSIHLRARSGIVRTHRAEVAVENRGSGVLGELDSRVELEGSHTIPWLAAGLTGSVAPTTLQLEATAQHLSPGCYQADVAVASPADPRSPRQLLVQLEVDGSHPWRPDADPGCAVDG